MNDDIFKNLGLEDSEFQKVIQEIKAKSPVHITNLDEQSNHIYIGMYFIDLNNNDLKNKLQEYSISNNINDFSILFFERRHIEELSKILYGAFSMFNELNKDTIISLIFQFIKILDKPNIYNIFIQEIKNIMEDFYKKYNTPIEIKIKFELILTYIWFIPYGRIDDIINDINEYYKKNGGNLNENNNKNAE